MYSSTDSEVPCGCSFTSGSCGHSLTVGSCGRSLTMGSCGHSLTVGSCGRSLTMGSCGHSLTVGSCGRSLTMGSCGHSFGMGSAVAIHQLMYGLFSWPGVGNKLPTVATLLPSPRRSGGVMTQRTRGSRGCWLQQWPQPNCLPGFIVVS